MEFAVATGLKTVMDQFISKEATLLFYKAISPKFEFKEFESSSSDQDQPFYIQRCGASFVVFSDSSCSEYSRLVASPLAYGEVVVMEVCIKFSSGEYYGLPSWSKNSVDSRLKVGLEKVFPDIWSAKACGFHEIYEGVIFPKHIRPLGSQLISDSVLSRESDAVDHLSQALIGESVNLGDSWDWMKVETNDGRIKFVPVYFEEIVVSKNGLSFLFRN